MAIVVRIMRLLCRIMHHASCINISAMSRYGAGCSLGTARQSGSTKRSGWINRPAVSALCLTGARQADRKFGELAGHTVNLDRAAVLLGDDVPADREAEPGAFPGGLGRDEGLEQFVPDLRRNAGAVVAHPHFNRIAEIARRHL